MLLDRLRESGFWYPWTQRCGNLTALGLHALQHRGQEGAGIVSYDGKNFNTQLSLGLVSDHFTKLQ